MLKGMTGARDRFKEGRVVKVMMTFTLLSGALLPSIFLPLMGVWVMGAAVAPYLEFPPATMELPHAPFSPIAFLLGAGVILLGIMSATRIAVGGPMAGDAPRSSQGAFPWWGWCALVLNLFFWAVAWSRFEWAEGIQRHTFTPLWLTYIVFVNALAVKRVRTSLMTERPFQFALLFPASALFWWLFEYLNRFVRNWHYSEVGNLSAWEYLIQASICFSTVLPAVLSTQVLFYHSNFLRRYCRRGRAVSVGYPKGAASAILAASLLVLTGLGVFPDYLFPFLWVAPLAIIVSLQSLFGLRHVLEKVSQGDWLGPVSAALAAICCGWFWEMWNYLSLAKWYYTIPFVGVLKVFEMPILGWAGYLPFGLQCAAAASLMGIWVEDIQAKDAS